MWAAVTVSRPLTVNVQQTLPVFEFNVIFAVPEAVGEPFGTSLLPSIVVLIVIGDEAANATAGRQARASRHAATTALRIRFSPRWVQHPPVIIRRRDKNGSVAAKVSAAVRSH